MGVLSEFLVVDDTELANLVSLGFKFDFARSDFSWKNIDIFAVAEIEAALFGTTTDQIEKERGNLYKDHLWCEHESDGPWVWEIRPPIVAALADFGPVDIRVIARQWGYEFNVPDDESIEFVTGMVEVSRKTLARHARLVLWVCL
jgi:hypothetical protein